MAPVKSNDGVQFKTTTCKTVLHSSVTDNKPS